MCSPRRLFKHRRSTEAGGMFVSLREGIEKIAGLGSKDCIGVFPEGAVG